MKSIKDLRNESEKEGGTLKGKKLTVSSIPTIVVMKRRAVRVFPGGRQVGLYYASQIDKYVTIPFGNERLRSDDNTIPMFEEAETIDELDRQTSMNAFAKLHHKATQSDSQDDMEKYVKKTASVGVMHLAKHARKHGWQTTRKELKNLLGYSKKYREVADLVEDDLNEVKTSKLMIPKTPEERAAIEAERANRNRSGRQKPVSAAPAAPQPTKPQKQKPNPNSKNSQRKRARAKVNLNSSNKQSRDVESLMNRDYGKLGPKQRSKLTVRNVARAGYDQDGVRGAVIGGITQAILNKTVSQKAGRNPTKAPSTVSESFRSNLEAKRQQQIDEGALETADDFVRATGNMLGGNYVAAGGNYAVNKVLGKKTTYSDELKKQRSYSDKAAKRSPKATKAGKVAGAALGIGLAGKLGAFKYLGKGARLAGSIAAGAAGGAAGAAGALKRPAKDVTVNSREFKGPRIIDPNETRKAAKSTQDVRDANMQRKYTQSALKEMTEVVLNGNTFVINSGIADKLVHVYETLTEDNKNKMIGMLQNESTQNKIIEFVTRY